MIYWDTYQVPYFSWEPWRSCSILVYFLVTSSTLLWSWGALAQVGFETKKLFASCILEVFPGSILLTAAAMSWGEKSGVVSCKLHKYSLWISFLAKLSYPHVLQPVSAILQWPVLLQRRAQSSMNGLLLFVQITDDLIQTSHQLAALLLLLVWGHTQSTHNIISLYSLEDQWHREIALVGC